MKVIRGAELNTDHRLIIGDKCFRKTSRKCRGKRYEKIGTENLRKTNKQEEYKNKMIEKMNELTKEELEDREEWKLEKRWEKIKCSILQVAEEVCGKKKINTGTKRTRWWTEEVKECVKRKKQAWKKYTHRKLDDDHQQYIGNRNEVKRM
ncbi:hypothetical protein L798_05999 [Zootermopsis nevadensis]|uniref:Uncharacterized protein n=1 Tax=Zootermopsis nevadensis TaxID=136037 RepID=A0A067QPT3_ZOONE|nr:hypothetical protein L798_05999 [Zootermopsis nevadensis]